MSIESPVSMDETEESEQENSGPMSIESPVSMDETEESETGQMPPIPFQALSSLPLNRLPNPFGKLNIKSKMDAIRTEMIRRAQAAADVQAARPTTIPSHTMPSWLRHKAKPRRSWFEIIKQRQQANLIPQAQQSAMPVSWQNVTHPDRESWERRGVPPSYAPISSAYPSPFSQPIYSGQPAGSYDTIIANLLGQMGYGPGRTITTNATTTIIEKLSASGVPTAPTVINDYMARNGITQMGANIQLSGCGFAAKRNPDGSVSVKALLAKSNERGDVADYSLVVPAAEAKKAMRFMLAWHKQQHANSPSDPTAPVAPAEPAIEVPAAPVQDEPEMAIVGAGLSVRKAYAKLRATPQAGRAGMLSRLINDLMPTPFKV
jgi:hypothetical protein